MSSTSENVHVFAKYQEVLEAIDRLNLDRNKKESRNEVSILEISINITLSYFEI
jgi:hypothetical protein